MYPERYTGAGYRPGAAIREPMSGLISALGGAVKVTGHRLGRALPRISRRLRRSPPAVELAPEPAGDFPVILLLNDCRDQVNYGAEALMEGLLHTFRAAIPKHTLRFIPSHWLIDSQFGFSAFHNGSSLVQPRAIWPEVADQFDAIADEWLAGRGGPGVEAYMRKMKDVDLLVLNGEGSMYRTNLSAIRELFIAWLAKTRLGIPSVFINGLVHLTAVVPVLPAMMRKTFSVLDAVAVRDPYSLRNVQEFMPDIPVRLIPDSALALPVELDEPSADVKALFTALGTKPFFCFEPGPMPIDYRFRQRSSLYRLITELKELVPTAVLVASAPAEGAMLQRLAADTNSIYLPQQPSYRDLMAVLARTRFLLSGRNHNPVVGALVGCPTISIASTSHKVHGICELLGFDAPYDGTDLWRCIDDIKAHAARHLAGGEALRASIKAKASHLGTEAFEFGTMIRDVLSERSAANRKAP